MIELNDDRLVFSFPDMHADAVLVVEFQRTLRVPDDGTTYPLPPRRGRFPLRHVDDFAADVPAEWLKHGGVMLPMYQAEAMHLSFHSPSGYPFAIKVAAGKINAVTGKPWEDGLKRNPQNYMVYPRQQWLDGYVVTKGTVRQFVAMPLGMGYSVEEQATGRAEFGGLQIQAFPLRAERWVPRVEDVIRCHSHGEPGISRDERRVHEMIQYMLRETGAASPAAVPGMALGMGGSMKQGVYRDRRRPGAWDTAHGSRCFAHLANALVWRQITGAEPPTVPPTAKEYTAAGLPWFDYYAADLQALEGSAELAGLYSIVELAEMTGQVALPENTSVIPANVVPLRAGHGPGEVREGTC